MRAFYRGPDGVGFALDDAENGIGDLSLQFKTRLRAATERGPELALRIAAELPTGDEEKLMGSGGVDLGLGAIAEWRRGRSRFVGSAGVVWVGEAEILERAGAELRVAPRAGLAWSWRASPRVALALQGAYYRSPIERSGFAELEKNLAEIAANVSYRARDDLWLSFGAIENLVVESGADFSLVMSAHWRLR